MDHTISLNEIISSLEQLGLRELQKSVEIHKILRDLKPNVSSDNNTTYRYIYDLQSKFNISGGWFWLFQENQRNIEGVFDGKNGRGSHHVDEL